MHSSSSSSGNGTPRSAQEQWTATNSRHHAAAVAECKARNSAAARGCYSHLLYASISSCCQWQ
jgi:hypothetical protein